MTRRLRFTVDVPDEWPHGAMGPILTNGTWQTDRFVKVEVLEPERYTEVVLRRPRFEPGLNWHKGDQVAVYPSPGFQPFAGVDRADFTIESVTDREEWPA